MSKVKVKKQYELGLVTVFIEDDYVSTVYVSSPYKQKETGIYNTLQDIVDDIQILQDCIEKESQQNLEGADMKISIQARINLKDKYPIGSQWECRDGSRAVVVDYSMNGMWCWVGNPNTTKFYHDNGECYPHQAYFDLIRPWKEKRVFEDEVVIQEHEDGRIAKLLLSDGDIDQDDGWKTISRMPFKITEGEGNDIT